MTPGEIKPRAIAKAARRQSIANYVGGIFLAAICMSVPLLWVWMAME